MDFAHLNNQAVQLLCKGHHEAAVSTFLASHDILKNAVAALTNDPRQQANDGASKLSSDSSHLMQRPTQDQQFYQSVSFNDEASAHDEIHAFHMYNRVFLLSTSEALTSVEQREASTAIILYNIAVACHSQGMATGDSFLLSKALHVYKTARSSAETWFDLNIGCNKSLPHLAILNNLAHVYASQMRIAETLMCFDFMDETFHETQGLPANDRDVFIRNLLLFQEGSFGASPAPAA